MVGNINSQTLFRLPRYVKDDLSIIRSMVFVAISYHKDLFEPRFFKTFLDFSPIQEYFEDLQLAIGIVEDLNLNTRIWTKKWKASIRKPDFTETLIRILTL